MKVLFDTNIVLDVLLNRSPWVNNARILWKANDNGQVTGFLLASALTDIVYVANRLTDKEKARGAVKICLEAFEICPVDRETLEEADRISGDDFEDNLQVAAALLTGLDAIVTRDKKGFGGSSVLVFTPEELIIQMNLQA